MKPPVVSDSEAESEFVVLKIVFADVHIISVAGNIVQRFIFDLYFLFCKFSAHISGGDQFFFDLGEVIFTACDIQSGTDGFQISDLFLCFFDQMGERFKGPLLFSVFIKIAFGIFLCIFCRI